MKYKKIIQIVAIIAMLIGALVMMAWIYEIHDLKSIFSGFATMKFNTALLFFIIGGCLYSIGGNKFDRFTRALSFLVVVFGSLSLAQDLFLLNLGIDELFIADKNSNYEYPGRMSVATAFCFMLLGVSLLLFRSESLKIVAQYILHSVTLISSFAIMGYLFLVPADYKFFIFSSTAAHTTVLFFILSISASLINHKLGFTGLFLENKIGNNLARKLFPALAAVILVLGFIRTLTHKYDLVNVELGIDLFTLSMIVASLFFIRSAANHLNDIAAQKQELVETQEALAASNEEYAAINEELSQLNEELLASNNLLLQGEAKQKKILHELEIYHTRLSIATHSASIGIWEFNLIDEGITWDDRMFALHGVKRGEFSETYEYWRQLMHPDDIHRIESQFDLVFSEDKGFYENEFRVVWPDKSIHYHHTFGKAIRDGDGKSVKMIGATIEVTDRVQKEIELIQAKEKAEENDRLKSAFMANMRHEIRNPMNAIIGFTKQLATPEITEAKRAEYSSIVIHSSQQLLSIIDDITSISLLETKQEHVNKSDVNINLVLSELEIQFTERAKTRDLKLILKKSLPDEESVVATDKSKLTRISINLITNALKFTHEGSVEFGYYVEENDLVLYVKDSGIGIEASQQKKIFESFQQADANINRKYGGTGLGLSICKGLTELIGGKIWLESEVGKGSTFYLSIPFSAKKIESDRLRTSPQVEIPTILVAEDEFINFHYLKIIFEKHFNCKLLHAANGEEAVELVKNNPEIVFVLMDISMPIMDGFDAARLIKEMKPELPIIAQTGYDIQTNKKYNPKIINDYISKPIDDIILVSKMTIHIPMAVRE